MLGRLRRRAALRLVVTLSVLPPALLAGLPAVAAPPAALPPFDCGGPFTREASHASIARHFGAGNVVSRTVHAPEGELAKATIVFPRDPGRRIEILWQDERRRRRPAQVSVSDNGAWRAPEGVAVGAGLAAVEAANGKAFVLYGFGWDYAGTVVDWEGGRLARSGCRLLLRFAPPPGPYPGEADGERAFRSDSEIMRSVDPVVYEMLLMFE